MRAAVLFQPGEPLRIERIPVPKPREGEVLIRVAACGVCHTDLHVMRGEVKFPTPAVLGHEITGTVVQLGPGVSSVAVGDRVACSFIMPCGTCDYCAVGRDDMCEKFFAMNRLHGQLYDGTTRLHAADGSPIWMYSMGGLAEYAVVPATDVFRLPPELPLDRSAILGCAVFTGYGAVRHAADVRPGERVAVVAAGGVGLNVIQWAKVFGALDIIALDVADDKLELAKKVGATHAVRADKEPVAEVMNLTGGRGVDVAIEALGSAQTFELAINLLRDGGRMVAVGIAPAGQTAALEIQRIVRRGIHVIGSYGARVRSDMPRIVEMAAKGLVDFQQSVTAVYPLDQAQAAYDDLKSRKITGRAIVVMNG
ncbi:MAG: alcohol dehydrogenase catalytic domain-containing protein [Alicyclobacillaceae bacterium]|nr:alcohol dehydrogenase catalytic domain-containing protein [Alicyclobacillaceae bacterium]